MKLEKLWPYMAWRHGQAEIAEAVYYSTKQSRHLLVSYPTGAGKTAPALVGALSAALEHELRVIYAVRTKAQFQAPRRELSLIAKRTDIRAVFLQNKRDLCLIKGAKLLPYDEFLNFCSELVRSGLCPHYALARGISCSVRILDVESLFNVAGSNACPYEVARSALKEADVVVAAYNYIFDPAVRRVFLEDVGAGLDRVLLIVDEAHNLPYSLASILSRELSERVVRAARREVARTLKRVDVEKSLYVLLATLRKLRRISAEEISESEIARSDLLEAAPNAVELSRLVPLVERNLGRASALRKLAAFLQLLESERPGYVVAARVEDGDFKLVALCTSPSRGSAPVFSNVWGSVLMSGTMPPKQYLVNLLGLEDWRTDEIRLRSPWAVNVGIVVTKGISSRFVERGEAMYEAMADFIDGLYARLRSGVCLVVAPSYNMAKALRPYLKATPLLVEREETRFSEVEEAVKRYDKLMVVGVAWGKLAEGVELKYDGRSAVKLVIVAGLPVPEPSILNKRLVENLKHKVKSSEEAWRLVYMVPAAVKVAQAIGRSVRSESDRAAVAILDERALEPDVKSYIESFGFALEPVVSLEEAASKLERFMVV